MLRYTRRRLRRRVRRRTPATLVGLAGLPGFARAANDKPPIAVPVVRVRSTFTSWRRCMCGSLLLKVMQELDFDRIARRLESE
jgi:hypothetical protein